jgi:ABC-type multidrug transport system fused ATPase/permease subunit
MQTALHKSIEFTNSQKNLNIMTISPLSKLLPRLWQHIKPRRRFQIFLLFFIMMLASLAEVISIGAVLPFLGVLTSPDGIFNNPMMQPFIRALGLSEPKQLLLPMTILFIVGALLSGTLRIILIWSQTKLSYAIGYDFSVDIYERTLYQPYAVHVKRNSSEMIASISGKASSVVGTTLLPLMVILSSILIMFSILLALLVIEPYVATTAFIGFSSIYIIIALTTKKALLRDGQRINLESNKVIKALQEGLGGIRDVLIDGTQALYCKIYSKADLPLRRAQANITIISAIPRYGVETLSMILIASLAYGLADKSSGIDGSIPVLGALALGAQRLLPTFQLAYSNWAAIRSGRSSLIEALDLLDQPMPRYINSHLQAEIPFKHNITLSNITFKYGEHDPWVFKNGLSLTIPKGSRVGFVGTTGCGKSTLLDIIMGLLEPSNGKLEIDGVCINERNYRGWQKHIAHVPQAIFLADTSVLENIAFGVPLEQIDHALVRKAAQKAQIAQTIESWNLQYNTLVGERGVRLSGGQRQRIGIARALYKKADVIILDEATSALDNHTENALMDSIENLGNEITIIMVAHRLTTLKNCMLIVKLSNGNIDTVGTYQDMIQSSS